jgi:hypothetical protein
MMRRNIPDALVDIFGVIIFENGTWFYFRTAHNIICLTRSYFVSMSIKRYLISKVT